MQVKAGFIDINLSKNITLYADDVGLYDSDRSTVLHLHVSTIAQSRQAQHWLYRGPFHVFRSYHRFSNPPYSRGITVEIIIWV